MSSDKNKHKNVSFLNPGNGEIVELVGEGQETMFLVFNVLKSTYEVAEKYEFEGTIYHPPKDDLVANGTILLPSCPRFGVSTPEIISIINDFIYGYLDVSKMFRKISSYYALLSWVYDSFEVLPYLRALGDFGTGKSRLLKVIGSICYRPMFAAGATTPSPIFRIIDMYHGTLVIDEADFRMSDASAEIIKILNCGYCKGLPVLRSEGDRVFTPRSYIVYGPKLIATRKKFEDLALESRCLTEIMTGKPRNDIPIHLPKSFDKEALEIRNLLLGFRLAHFGEHDIKPELIIPRIEPRINQIILPIMSIIEDNNMREEIKSFVCSYADNLKSQRGEELPAEILRTMVTMINEKETLLYKNIAKRINADRNKEQGEYMVSPAKIGRINNSLFNFESRVIHGITEILWESNRGKDLCDRYGVEMPNPDTQVDLVDDVDDSGTPDPSGPDIPNDTGQIF